MKASSISYHKLELALQVCRGKTSQNFALQRLSWLKVGGPAEVLFQPEDEEDLVIFMKNLSAEIPVFVIGACSNLIIRDGGIPGVVIRLGGSFSKINFTGKTVSILSLIHI